MDIPLQWVDASIAALFGLLVGSFLNVLIYRLPKMMEQEWAVQCAEFTGAPNEAQPKFNLMVPRSRCPHCGHAIRWHENIPILGYLRLGGKCAACKAPISLRYPLIEFVTGCLFFYCGWRFGIGLQAVIWCAFSAILLALAMIDWDTTLLPDDLTLPLMWGGLLSAALHYTSVDLHASLWGAVGGYLSLWGVYWAFKLATGKEGMGYGDFKLFAALGAWFGWQALIPMILIASIIGTLVGLVMKFSTGLREGNYVPFGPFLAGAGMVTLLAGTDTLLQLTGL
jgi:leader peptidase (prepilin peptidase) / N-methyltransferase